MNFFKIFLLVITILLFGFFLGPRPADPEINGKLPALNLQGAELENFVNTSEKKMQNIKPDNEARIIWFDSLKKNKTEYAVVYLHGYSASQGEGDPVHSEFAKRYGCNLFVSRLFAHGLNDQEAMLNLSPEKLVESAKQAIAIGKQLGGKVILMSTSTGATLSLYVASENPEIHSLILYSPNIDLYDSRSFILTQPWGLQIARFIQGGNYYHFSGRDGVEKYWTTRYRIEALISLKVLLQETMKEETFKKIKQPVFMGYYEKDDLVSVPRMHEMFDELSTAGSLKRKVSFPKAGNHCLPSPLWSQDVEGVQKETYRFAEEVLELKPIN